MASVTRTITPEQRRRAVMVGVLGGFGVMVMIGLQVIVTLTRPAPVQSSSKEEEATNERLIEGMESIKESVSGLGTVTQEMWEVAEDEVQNQ